MEVKAKSIDLTKVQELAEESFRKGFFCCEAVMETIIDQFELDAPRELIGMASGMAVGVGKSGCICACDRYDLRALRAEGSDGPQGRQMSEHDKGAS